MVAISKLIKFCPKTSEISNQISFYLIRYFNLSGAQKIFLKQANSIITTMKEMGNPFSDTSGDLLVLDTREVADASIVESVKQLQKLGEDQCNEFFQKRLVDRSTNLKETVTKNKLHLLR